MSAQEWSAAGMDGTYLQIELQRVGLCLQRAVQSWKLAGQDPDDAFRGLYITDVEAESLLARPLASGWGHTVSLPPEIETSLERQMALVRREAQAVIDESVRCGHTPTLENLRAIFGLSQFELDTLLICLAPSVDLRYERIFGYLQDDVTKKRPSVSLILDLLADTGIGRMALLAHFDQTAPLLRHHLLELRGPAEAQAAPLLSCFLYVDESILSWLLGSYRPHSDLTGALVLDVQPAAGLEPFVDAAVSQQIVDVAASPLYVFHGPDAEAQLVAGRLVASTTGSPLLIANLGAAIEGGRTGLLRTVQLALRDARLTRAVPMFTGWDVCLVDGTTPPAVLHELDGFQGTVIVAGQALWYPRGRQRGKPALAIEFAVPSYEQRHRLWAHFIDALGDDAGSAQGHTVAADDLEALAGQFMLTSGQIRDAATTARDQALGRGARIDGQDLFAAARAHSNPRLATLAHKIEPHYGWDDIILPDDQRLLLMEIVDTVRGRPQVLDAWGVGQKLASSRGVTVLFAGPPGTGKTMAAEIIAGELGLDLYRIDLSTIVSKYIGETEKNIERIFQEAEQSNAILFFDEADALFGKRSEVRDSHDRYANIEISYLLQRMESYDGVTILATNLRGNLDEAFTRRLQFAVAFPFPEAEDRARIWDTLFPPGVPRAPDVDLDHLAQTFRLAGGNIRNVIVSAAYLAAADGDRVTMAHLLHATRRELQKMGRLVRQEDLVSGS